MAALHEPCGPADLVPIGVIHSPYLRRRDAPRQGRLSDKESVIEVFPAYAEGLRDVEYYSRLIALYWFDRSDRTLLVATPPGSNTEHGVFATRSPDTGPTRSGLRSWTLSGGMVHGSLSGGLMPLTALRFWT